MGRSELVAPVSSSDGNNGELGGDDRSTDGGSNFLGALDTKTDMAVVVADGDERLEARALTGPANKTSHKR